MYATGVERSMLCSLTSYSTIPRFKFPAHSRPTVEFGGKPIKALSQSTTFDKEDDDDDDDSVENHTCKSHGRRTVVLMSTISFLFPLHISNEAFGATVEEWIANYANNQDLFFEDFKNAYTKLVNSGARWRKSI